MDSRPVIDSKVVAPHPAYMIVFNLLGVFLVVAGTYFLASQQGAQMKMTGVLLLIIGSIISLAVPAILYRLWMSLSQS